MIKNGGDIDPNALRCIIHLAGHKNKKMHRNSSTTKAPINSQSEVVNLIVSAVLKSFELHEQINHSSIVSDGVSALRNLGADIYCVNLVLSLIDRGLQVDDDVLNIAKKMALSEGNVSALKTMESLSP